MNASGVRQARDCIAALVPIGALRVLSFFAAFLEIQRGRVDAVTQPRRARAVGEHVPQVPAAAGAADLGADHAVAAVLDGRLAPWPCFQ